MEKMFFSDLKHNTKFLRLGKVFHFGIALFFSLLIFKPVYSEIPRAIKIPFQHKEHGVIRDDPYFYMKNRADPRVIDYINRENKFFLKWAAKNRPLENEIFEQLKSQIQQVSQSVPIQRGPYLYSVRYREGEEYQIYVRRGDSILSEEEVLLDVNLWPKKKGQFLEISSFKVSPDHRWAAFAVDSVGRRIYQLYIKNLQTKEVFPLEAQQVVPNLEWGLDSRSLYYVTSDPKTLRFDKIYRTQIGKNPSEKDQLLWYEPDETYFLSIRKSSNQKTLFLESSSTLTTETKWIDLKKDPLKSHLFSPRERGVEYLLEDGGDRFFIHTNQGGAREFKLCFSEKKPTKSSDWKILIPQREGIFLSGFSVFEKFILLEEKEMGHQYLRVVQRDGGHQRRVQFSEKGCVLTVHSWQNYYSPWFRFTYESLTTPPSVFEEHFHLAQKINFKTEGVGGGFQKKNYLTKRVEVLSHDGKKILVTLLFRKETPLPAPTLLYGYGAYGETIEPVFDRSLFSLVDRGFVYGIAHIRGGQMLGRRWYEEGRQEKKINSFLDFISCGEGLIQQGFTQKKNLYAKGESAGGLLMGAVINIKPELFHGVIAGVPFVDVVTTMLDTSIPLTTAEFDEWGNPALKGDFDRMLAYSPYDQVSNKNYPHLLVLSGLHDSQVQYFEPTKWVARLREKKANKNHLFLVTNMKAGHGGASGRYEVLHETARDHGFFIRLFKENR